MSTPEQHTDFRHPRPDPTADSPDAVDRRTDSPSGPVGDETERPAPAGTTDASQAGSEGRERLVPRERADAYGSRWDAVKGTFVDEPRHAVAEADQLVGELLDELQELFRKQRQSLEHGLDADETSTEDLRLALRRYRSFFDRLLSFEGITVRNPWVMAGPGRRSSCRTPRCVRRVRGLPLRRGTRGRRSGAARRRGARRAARCACRRAGPARLPGGVAAPSLVGAGPMPDYP